MLWAVDSFFSNLFLTVESWIAAYVAVCFLWFWIASWKLEKAKYVAWAGLLISTILFAAGLFSTEVRQYFYRLWH